MDPAKLKVIELRAELSARGLDTKGVKAVLVERLKQALEEETGQELPDTSIADTSTENTSLVEDKTEQSETGREPDPNLSSEAEREQSSDKEPEKELPSEPEREPTPEPPKETEKEQSSESQLESEEVQEPQQTTMENVSIKQEPYTDEYRHHGYEEKPNIRDKYQGYDDKKEHYEAEVKIEPGLDIKDEKQQYLSHYDDRKRKRSRSPPSQKQGWGQSQGWGRKDDEPDLDDGAVVLGWYDSDLNLEINKTDFLEAAPMSNQGFGYIWAGCRSTYGFSHGKVCYEVKLLENHDVTHLEDEPSPHVLRIGWSVLSSSMLLGEEPMSFGYGGTAKASTNCKFTNYGTTFVVGDTITAYLEYGDRIKMSYSVNGAYQRDAFNIPASQVNNQPLFPHLLSKNIKFRVNFGTAESEFKIQPGYTWCANVPLDQREAGPRRPERREECEMLMMCGLPGCGKTTWANAYVQEHPDKFYNILGTNNLIDKMKIQGLPRKRNYSGRWDVLIDKCTKCLNKLLEMASRRRRNYILDQTNVYPSAQKRKMRNFGGFIRRAIVIVPTDEEFQRRCAKREAEEGKDIPDSAVLEMKANFRLPEKGEHFDEVRYIELNEEESRPLVEQYNKEGRAAGFGQQTPFSGQGGKRFRPDDRPPFRGGGGRGGGGFRGGRGGPGDRSGSGDRGGSGDRSGGFGGGMDRRDRSNERGGRGGFRSGPPMKGGMDRGGGRGGWQPRGGGSDRGGRGGGSDRGGRGGGSSGWRDRSPQNYDRDSGDNRPSGGGPWRNNRSVERDRPYDRNQRGGSRGGRGGGSGSFERDNFRDNDFGNNRGGGGGGFKDGSDYNRGGGGGSDRDNFSRGGGRGGGFDRDQRRGGGFNREGGGFNNRERGGFNNRDGGSFNNREGGGFNNRDGGGGFRDGGSRGGRGGGRGGFDRDQRGGGGRGGFDRNRGSGSGGGYNDRQGGGSGGNRDVSFDRNRSGSDRGSRDNKGGGNNQGGSQTQGWGNNQGYSSGWGQQGYNNQQQQGYNQSSSGYNQGGGGGNTGYTQGYSAQQSNQQQQQQQQQPQQQQGWGQQNWGSKGYGSGTGQQQQQQPVQQQQVQQAATAATATSISSVTGYNTGTGYTQPATGYSQAQYPQSYWSGQYNYGQGWTQVPK